MDDDSGFRQIYDDIVRKHNLSSPGDLAIARSLASVMVTDDGSSPVTTARAIANLTDLLPGAAPVGQVNKIELELVSPNTAEYVAYIEDRMQRAEEECRRKDRRIFELEQPGCTARAMPADPMRTTQPPAPGRSVPDGNAATADSNVVPLQPQPDTAAARAEAVRQRRRAAGDVVDVGWQRSPFSADRPLHGEGNGRFDFPTNRGGW